jgi:hypothetical protein
VAGPDPIGEFLDWAKSEGMPAGQRDVWKRIGLLLLERARGSRVTEGHVLALIDDQPEGIETATIEEIGDRYLRYQRTTLSLAMGTAPTRKRDEPKVTRDMTPLTHAAQSRRSLRILLPFVVVVAAVLVYMYLSSH